MILGWRWGRSALPVSCRFLKTGGRSPPQEPCLYALGDPSPHSRVTSAASSLLCLQNYFESYLSIASTVPSVLCLVANFLLVNR